MVSVVHKMYEHGIARAGQPSAGLAGCRAKRRMSMCPKVGTCLHRTSTRALMQPWCQQGTGGLENYTAKHGSPAGGPGDGCRQPNGAQQRAVHQGAHACGKSRWKRNSMLEVRTAWQLRIGILASGWQTPV